jgi:hypothetical protein
VWQELLNTLKVNRFDQAKDPRQCSQRGVGGIVCARGDPGHMDCCGTRRSDSLVSAS